MVESILKLCFLTLLWYLSFLLYNGVLSDFLTLTHICIGDIVLLVRWPLLQIRPLGDKYALVLTTI